MISRWQVLGYQQYYQWCHLREISVQNDFQVIGARISAIPPVMSPQRNLSESWTKSWGESVQFFNLREWQVFLWMFICLYNRKLIFSFWHFWITECVRLSTDTINVMCWAWVCNLPGLGHGQQLPILVCRSVLCSFTPRVCGFLNCCGLPAQLCGVTTVLLSWLCFKGDNPVA